MSRFIRALWMRGQENMRPIKERPPVKGMAKIDMVVLVALPLIWRVYFSYSFWRARLDRPLHFSLNVSKSKGIVGRQLVEQTLCIRGKLERRFERRVKILEEGIELGYIMDGRL